MVASEPEAVQIAGVTAIVAYNDRRWAEAEPLFRDVIASAEDPPQSADQFEATVVWMSDDALIPGRGYWLKLATQTVTATVAGVAATRVSAAWLSATTPMEVIPRRLANDYGNGRTEIKICAVVADQTAFRSTSSAQILGDLADGVGDLDRHLLLQEMPGRRAGHWGLREQASRPVLQPAQDRIAVAPDDCGRPVE